MQRLRSFLLFGLVALATPALAQDATGPCASPDSIEIQGHTRVTADQIRGTTGLVPRTQIGYRDVQRAIRDLFATGQFEDVQIDCVVSADQRAVLTIAVRERPILSDFSVVGVDRLSVREVTDRLELPVGQPLDPARVARAIERADSLYKARGYYLASVTPETTFVDERIRIRYVVDEGRRLAVSGIRVSGTEQVPVSAVVGAMKTKPEGFLWFRRGEFDDVTYAQDLSERLPDLFGSRGFIDFRVVSDTLIVNRDIGKGLIELGLQEGPRYQVGSFEILGNRRFRTEELREFYPFDDDSPTVAERTMRLFRRGYRNPPGTFDVARWEEAHEKLVEAYSNEGYIYARISPIVERVPGETGGERTVNLRWEIDERSPAIVNRIEIAGNDYTSETCIREQLVMIPGQVFNRNALIRSYQNIANLNFFESPLPPPETRPSGEEGDIDIVFNVTEKRTGNLNFGASMGQGTGLGGFIGVDQPNLFGRCKRAQLNWQFGRYINDFQGTYSDPNIRQSRISGSLTGYHTRSRFRIADLGQSTRTGGQIQAGFPVPRSFYSRVYVSYGGEAVRYKDENQTLLGELARSTCRSCFRSTLGLTGTHDTRIGLPFPIDGGLQSLSAQFNGGMLGGTSDFQRYTTELRSYAPLAQFGNPVFTGQPIQLTLGLTARAGAVFGDPGPFFFSQAFALGGTQYGEQLRGYEEFSITPAGFDPTAGETSARRGSFGNSFFTGTGEIGLRVSQMLYFHTFFEGGNVWHRPREFNPTRLFRSAGFGVGVISPLGPIGIDMGYAFDRLDVEGRRNPGWKMHFKLGQLF